MKGCKRCGKSRISEVHSCTKYYHYKWVTGTWTLPNKETFDFIVDEVSNFDWDICLRLKLTSWKHKGKYSAIYDYEIDKTLKFNV